MTVIRGHGKREPDVPGPPSRAQSGPSAGESVGRVGSNLVRRVLLLAATCVAFGESHEQDHAQALRTVFREDRRRLSYLHDEPGGKPPRECDAHRYVARISAMICSRRAGFTTRRSSPAARMRYFAPGCPYQCGDEQFRPGPFFTDFFPETSGVRRLTHRIAGCRASSCFPAGAAAIVTLIACALRHCPGTPAGHDPTSDDWMRC